MEYNIECSIDCNICQETSVTFQKFGGNPLVKNWYPEKINGCDHLFCNNCIHNWIISCLMEGRNFSCPICRFVYIPHDRLYHAYGLYACFAERNNILRRNLDS